MSRKWFILLCTLMVLVAALVAAIWIFPIESESDRPTDTDTTRPPKTTAPTETTGTTAGEEERVLPSGEIVVDAVNYSRVVDLSDPQFDYALDMGYKTGDYHHNIVIPKLNVTSENADKFNAKIYSLYETQYTNIVNHTELQPLQIRYTFKCQNGLVGILITEQGGPIAGGGWDKYQCLYYDLNNDCEMSFDEYLSDLGTSYAGLWSWLVTTDEYKEFVEWGLDKILGAILDEASMEMVVNLPMGYNAEWKFSFEQSVLSNLSTVSENGIVLDTPYFTLTLPSSWAGKYVDEFYVEGKEYGISISEKQSYDALSNDDWRDDGEMYGIGGHLATYGATFDPDSVYLSAIGYCVTTGLVDGETVYIFRAGPTDIQYTKKGEQQYVSMQNELNKIILTLKDEYKGEK